MIREAYERIWYKAKPFFYAANLSPRPFSIQMDITDKCNFRCPGCSKWKGESKEEMGTGQWKSVLSKLKGFAFTNYISVTGGEPFMRHDLFEILRHAKSLGFKICLLTNGSMLDEEKVRELSAIGVEDINISLNSLKEDLHDQTRGVKGSWKKIMDLIPKLKNYRINSNISVVLTNENLDEIPAMARMVKENMLNLLNIQVLADYRVHSPLSKANPKIELDWHKKEKQWIKDKKRLSFTIKKLIRQGIEEKIEQFYLKTIVDRVKEYFQAVQEEAARK